jgi:hypothetical protein
MRGRVACFAPISGALLAGACGHDMMGPDDMGGHHGPADAVALVSVSPAAGATGVAVNAPITVRFSGPMAAGMEQYLDLHLGDLSGPTVGLACGWSADRTQLTCNPTSALASHTSYAIHLGGGLMSAGGTPLDYTTYGPAIGGQWIMGGMMTGSHGGASWGMMGGDWRNTNGSYGMVFSFTTA